MVKLIILKIWPHSLNRRQINNNSIKIIKAKSFQIAEKFNFLKEKSRDGSILGTTF